MPAVTIKDVAREAGVGVGTVSRVFNRSTLVSQETQQRVLAAADKLGYYPDVSARRLVKGRTRIIAFIERHTPRPPFVDAFMAEVLRGIHSVVIEEDYHILIEPCAPGEKGDRRLLNLIREKHADGLIISGPRIDDPIYRSMPNGQIPVVLQGYLPGEALACVDVDNYTGAYQATEYLLSLGHRRIAMISNGPFVYTAAEARKAGYLAALEKTGIEIFPEYICEGAFSPESGYQAMQSLLSLDPRPSAVFIASDTVAIGAIKAIEGANLLIPEDISIVGFDDIAWSAYLSPPLTTVRLPAQEIGEKAARLLMNLLSDDKTVCTQEFLPTRLILRGSCQPYSDNSR